MSVTFGFYNSVNHDRRYNALQMSSIFDGIIRDGIFMSIGEAMVVKAASGMTVNVGEGRAWFDHTWTLNDSELPVKLEASELIYDRIDTIVLDVDHRDSVRANSIIAIKGTPARDPVAPTLIRTTDHNQYPLCNIRVKAGVTEITQSNITNLVGTGSCPFVTGILESIDIEDLVSQWEAQWDEWKKQWNGVDVSEFQSQLDTIQTNVKNLQMQFGPIHGDMNDWIGSDTVYQAVTKLKAKDTDLQSQIDNLGGADVSEFQSQLDTKVDKVEGKGLSTNDYGDRAKEKVSKIGNTDSIPSDSRYIVQWIQDVYDSVFKSSADNTCLADRVAAEISHRQSADENLQSQIDALGDNVSNLQSADATAMDKIGRLITADENLQSQLDTKATRKVAIVGSDTANSDGWYKVASGTMGQYQVMSLLFAVHRPDKSGKYSGILQLDLRGGTEAILTGDELKLGWLVRTGFDLSQVIVTVDGYNWALYYNLRSSMTFRTFFEVIQESSGTTNKAIYNLHTDSVVEATAPVATVISTDLGTVNTANKLTTARNINGIAFDGSKDINITANDIPSTSGNSLAYEVGTTRTDLDAVKARIGSWGTSKTLYDMIADLTARIKTLESISGGGVPQAVLIDWDVNTNGATQGTVTKDANGLHASGDKSLRIANCWNCDVSAYDGITFTAYGSGKLRVEVGGIEGEYKTLGTKPTTYTIAFDDIGLTELSSIEINLQTQGAYDLTISDIFGYTYI